MAKNYSFTAARAVLYGVLRLIYTFKIRIALKKTKKTPCFKRNIEQIIVVLIPDL